MVFVSRLDLFQIFWHVTSTGGCLSVIGLEEAPILSLIEPRFFSILEPKQLATARDTNGNEERTSHPTMLLGPFESLLYLEFSFSGFALSGLHGGCK